MTDTPTKQTLAYQDLSPDCILDAVESAGLRCNGHLHALNSYENRVYQIGLEEGGFIVAKFYRPGRWSDAAIQEEHDFAWELAEREIPVVPPLRDERGETVHQHAGFRYALYPRRGGRWPDLDNPDNLLWLGRFIGRIHAVGRTKRFASRPALTPERFGRSSIRTVQEEGWLPPHLDQAFDSLTRDLMGGIERAWAAAGDFSVIRLHGDCHPGNLLWRDGPFFVDLDDCQSGPAIQDLWMLLSGDRNEMELQLADVVEGYRQFCDFDYRELLLVEALRTLRMLHHAAWLARRWEDPAFPIAFPWFDSPRFWENLILDLREQAAAMQEPALSLTRF